MHDFDDVYVHDVLMIMFMYGCQICNHNDIKWNIQHTTKE